MSWKQLVTPVAPTIGKALEGPLGNMATNLVIETLGLPQDAESEVIEKQLSSNPEQLKRVKEAEGVFKSKLKELDIDLEKIYEETSLQHAASMIRDKIPGILAVCVTAGFFGTLGWMLIHGLPKDGGEALLVMLGALGAGWGSVTNYYFGSSSGSKQKSDLLAARR